MRLYHDLTFLFLAVVFTTGCPERCLAIDKGKVIVAEGAKPDATGGINGVSGADGGLGGGASGTMGGTGGDLGGSMGGAGGASGVPGGGDGDEMGGGPGAQSSGTGTAKGGALDQDLTDEPKGRGVGGSAGGGGGGGGGGAGDFDGGSIKGGSSGVRKCTSDSQKFKGLCFNNDNCDTMCATEGFQSGHCAMTFLGCKCTKPC